MKVFVTPGSVVTYQIPRLATHFASMEGLPHGSRNTGADGVEGVVTTLKVEAQSTEFLFDLGDLKGSPWPYDLFELFAQPPHEIEPAVAVLKTEMQAGLRDIAI
jgi:hypothetical protein